MTAPTLVLTEAVIERVNAGYVFPEAAARVERLLRARVAEGAYDLPVGPELCARISADLFEATADLHLRLLWYDTSEPVASASDIEAELSARFRRENHGVRRVEQLPGNVGLLELTLIPPVASAGLTLAAAMQLVHGTEALILDLRAARGGAPDGVTFLCSYFFPDGDVHLTDIIEGSNGPTRQFWTQAFLPSPRYLHRPVYVLTGPITFSGGESLAYDLQALGRATLIGEATGGGAHPSEPVPVADHVELRLPVARTINPVTGTNWEGVGVQPDINVSTDDALGVAHRVALRAVIDRGALARVDREEAERALAVLDT